ncbi:hypothetical protein LWI29_030332 [Acer saccharum]|uniref:LysM domain-containing protein n=1 Tax=Acer saccharum TaxID=4024 RepID=A0AA39VEA8_ACESA|nr:hypothetical protein LWI29_030332 [Acer saccharum]KAK1568202.1 hypothetical protein Q3G72_021628 [Acer saccharum]
MERRNYNSNGDYDFAFTYDKGHIEHPVSKLDTLAGIAIKYGVEVADIKKMNGLATDLQMFARKSLQIPLPGKHPPSPCLTNASETSGQNNSEQISPHHVQCDLIDSFQSLRLTTSPQRNVSPAMSSLQGFYGLRPMNQTTTSEGFEMAICRKGESKYFEDSPFLWPSPGVNLPLVSRQKSRSLANGLVDHNGELADKIPVPYFGESDSGKRNEKPVRRRQKSEDDFTSRTPEMLLKEENSIVSGFSGLTGKGLALRAKSASRTASPADGVGGGLGDYLLACGVRKSSSMSSLHDSDGSSSSSSVWPSSMWSLKPDLQALSSVAITKPIFDGLPKPITGRRNKAAID